MSFGLCKDLKRSLPWALQEKRGLFSTSCHLFQRFPLQPLGASLFPTICPAHFPYNFHPRMCAGWAGPLLWQGEKDVWGSHAAFHTSMYVLLSMLTTHQVRPHRPSPVTEGKNQPSSQGGSGGFYFLLVRKAGETKLPEGRWSLLWCLAMAQFNSLLPVCRVIHPILWVRACLDAVHVIGLVGLSASLCILLSVCFAKATSLQQRQPSIAEV